MRARCVAPVLLLTLAMGHFVTAVTLPAQPRAAGVARATPAARVVRWGKWVLLGTAVAFGSYALAEHRRAEHAYEALRVRCRGDATLCDRVNGRYTDVTSEQFHQRATAGDRRARVGIIGGQIALLGSAALFVYDLRNGRGPANIPYHGARAAAPSAAAGVRLAF